MPTTNNWRVEKAKVEYLLSVIEPEARRKLGYSEAAKDCVVVFLEQTYVMVESEPWPLGEEAQAKLSANAGHFAHAAAERLRRLHAHELLLLDAGGQRSGPAQFEPPSWALGPEHICLLANVMELVSSAVARLPCHSMTLFNALFVEGKSHIDIAAESGRSRQSVDRSVARLLAAIRRILSSWGLTDAEIAGLLNELARCRSPRRAGRRSPLRPT